MFDCTKFLKDNPMFGIRKTIHHGKPSFEIHVGHIAKNNNTMFRDRVYIKSKNSLKKAQEIRNKAFIDLVNKGWKPKHWSSKYALTKRSCNKTGVTGVSFIINKNKNKEACYPAWLVRYKNIKGFNKSRTFSFSKFDNPKEAFIYAVKCRKKEELKKFGKTIIDISKIEEYWKQAKTLIGDN